jgi:hypothetical protein
MLAYDALQQTKPQIPHSATFPFIIPTGVVRACGPSKVMKNTSFKQPLSMEPTVDGEGQLLMEKASRSL